MCIPNMDTAYDGHVIVCSNIFFGPSDVWLWGFDLDLEILVAPFVLMVFKLQSLIYIHFVWGMGVHWHVFWTLWLEPVILTLKSLWHLLCPRWPGYSLYICYVHCLSTVGMQWHAFGNLWSSTLKLWPWPWKKYGTSWAEGIEATVS